MAGPSRSGVDVDAVTALVERVAREVVSPRFRALQAGEVGEKGVGDVVTVVDTEAEAAIEAGLAEIAPGVPVVGEEATSADGGVLRTLTHAPLAFVVDPLDGTRAFVDGSPDHAVMVGLVDHGEAVAGWICLPAHGHTFVAERGGGAWRDGERLPMLGGARGNPIAGGWLPADLRAGVPERAAALGLERVEVDRRLWSGYHYALVAQGLQDALVYWRTWPWDHTPGAVLVREVGGVVRRPDGSDYRPDGADHGAAGAEALAGTGTGGRTGLVVAADERTFHDVREAFGLA